MGGNQGVKWKGDYDDVKISELRKVVRFVSGDLVSGRCGEPHTTRIHHKKPLGGFGRCRLQGVWGTLSEFLLNGLPTLRGQLGGSIVDVFIKMNGYESIKRS